MTDLVEAYPWVWIVPAIGFVLLFAAGQTLFAKYGYFKVRCPNCKLFNSYKVEYKDTGITFTRIAVNRSGVAREVEYKTIELTYTCTACRHQWEATKELKA